MKEQLAFQFTTASFKARIGPYPSFAFSVTIATVRRLDDMNHHANSMEVIEYSDRNRRRGCSEHGTARATN